MITYHQFQKFYPSLYSCFAQLDTTSPTYTRKTKTGKMSIVRKGKREKKGLNPLRVGATLGGLAVTSGIGILGGKRIGQAVMTRLLKNRHTINSANKVLISGAGEALAGGTGGALGLISGAAIGSKIARKIDKD